MRLESPFNTTLDGVAAIAANKWFTAMGLIGMVAFTFMLFIELPTDRIVSMSIPLAMMGWGFGQTECQKIHVRTQRSGKQEYLVWRWTIPGVLMFCIATGAVITLLGRSIYLLGQG